MDTLPTQLLTSQTKWRSKQACQPAQLARMTQVELCVSIRTTSRCTMWTSRTPSVLVLRPLPSVNTVVAWGSMHVVFTDIRIPCTPTKVHKFSWKVTSKWVHFFGIYATYLTSKQGAVDFIFGRQGLAYFGGNTIAVKAAGCITASGRQSDDSGSCKCEYLTFYLFKKNLLDVFEKNTIVLASGAASGINGKIYLGRPWSDYAKWVYAGLRCINFWRPVCFSE